MNKSIVYDKVDLGVDMLESGFAKQSTSLTR